MYNLNAKYKQENQLISDVNNPQTQIGKAHVTTSNTQYIVNITNITQQEPRVPIFWSCTCLLMEIRVHCNGPMARNKDQVSKLKVQSSFLSLHLSHTFSFKLPLTLCISLLLFFFLAFSVSFSQSRIYFLVFV